MRIEAEHAKHVVTPKCCEKARTTYAVHLTFRNSYDLEDWGPPDPCPPGTEWQPRWTIATLKRWESGGALTEWIDEAKFCPFCGKALPEVEFVEPPGPVVRCTDGGYYCDVCNERLMGCECLPPDVCWRVKQ